MSKTRSRSDRPRSRRSFALAAALAVTSPYWIAIGCGSYAPTPVSPVVAADSDEARKALAEDRAHRAELKRKEAKAAARHKKLVIPARPE